MSDDDNGSPFNPGKNNEPLLCGDVGGVTKDGEPCQRPAKGGTPCWRHTDDPPTDLGGRPSHEPTELTKRFVENAVLGGVDRELIAEVLEISERTMYRHYGETLEKTKAKANAKVSQTLFQMAVSGKNLGATIFWLKTQAGWSEKPKQVQVDHTTGGQPITTYLPAKGCRQLGGDEVEAEVIEPDDE